VVFGEVRSGGDTTVFNVSRDAFARPAANLDDEATNDFFTGNALFNRNWVTAPSSTSGLDGLGPVFNARSCSACHFKDGRGRPPLDEIDPDPSLLTRISLPGVDSRGGPLPDPVYGDQIQPFGILGVPGEASVRITYVEESGAFLDGTPYSLQRPHYEVVDAAFGPLPANIMLSPRVAPALIGLGLLAAIDEATLHNLSDENDHDGDGISGRTNRVWDVRRNAMSVGRFGWKARRRTVASRSSTTSSSISSRSICTLWACRRVALYPTHRFAAAKNCFTPSVAPLVIRRHW
jgi:CxxC motif-containing protein (DUF1111 family)